MEKKLSAMPHAKAKVVIMPNGLTVLRSYETNVVYLRPDGWLSIQGLYSTTTRKHISAFVKEYANITYQLAKELYTRNMIYNIYTGEVVER